MTSSSPKFKSLGTRIVSGIVLALICWLPLYYGGWWIVALGLGFGVLMVWEWIGMTDYRVVNSSSDANNHKSGLKSRLFKASTLILLCSLIAALLCGGAGLWRLSLGLMVFGGAIAATERLKRGGSIWAGLGAVYLILPCLAFIWLRGHGAGVGSDGFKKLVFVLLVVAAADSFAYLGGTIVKGPKLAPKISPNKTWSGTLSGLVGGMIIAYLVSFGLNFQPIHAALLAVPLIIISMFGDLLESAIKRHLNVKDTGDVLPGHGGILDRVDGLMAGCVLAAGVLLFWPSVWLYLVQA